MTGDCDGGQLVLLGSVGAVSQRKGLVIMRRRIAVIASLFLAAGTLYASVFGTVRGIVHDPQHRPVADAEVVLRSQTSSWSSSARTDSGGAVQFLSVPIGQYWLQINVPGFKEEQASVTAASDRVQEVHLQLKLASVQQAVEVRATGENVNPSSSTPETAVSRLDIAQTPGADRTNSLSFITNFVPGSYVVHDQLHVRGGHQVTWAIDGVPVPNTNIASNVGPQFDPKDVEYMEVQRGSYLADYGDRTYGVFNVAPRSGFERTRMAELVASYGSFNQTDNQLSFGDHTDRFAYYVSANGNRTDHGLATPTFDNLHNQGAGGGAFTSLTYNARNDDQFRFVGSFRSDFYQVPNDADSQSAGVRDREREQDAFANFTYLHRLNSSTMLSVTPFFHFNRAAFEGGVLDVPSATDNRASTYGGGQISLAYVKSKHNAKIGFYAFGQRDNTLFSLVANDGSDAAIRQREKLNGNLEALFLEDQYRPLRWLTVNAGVRFTRFSGELTETAGSPRIGAAVQLPKVNWVLRASYSRFYQAPPLSTVSGPLLDFAVDQGVGFLPLRGERDEQHDFGLTIPLQGWALDFDYFRTGARNFFDHDALGNSNMFFPLTIDRVRIRGFESAVKSPRLFNRANIHLAYSHQSVQGQGAVSGGLTDFSPPEEGLFFLDHDQRNTLSTGLRTELPWHSWLAAEVHYGSGFLNGDGPQHLPSYHTVDLSIGKSFGENWSAKLTATNLADARYFVDLSNTFGGSHVADPRIVALQVRYRFHY
jgi:outer membrane receptor protein involved in Fe transport